MAQDIKIKVDIDTDDANKDLKGLNKNLDKTGKELDDVGKAGKKSKGGLGAMASGFKGIGMAIKAAGIGLVLSLIAGLFSLLKENQVVMDFMNKATRTMSILFNKLLESILPMKEAISGLFDNPTESLKNFIDGVKNWLMTSINGWLDTFKFLGKTLESVFELDWEGVKENSKKVGESILQATTGIDDLPGKVKKIGVEIVKTFEESTTAADKYVKKQNELKLAEAELNKYVAGNRLELEKLKGVREDETKSMDERIAASDRMNELIQEEQDRAISLQEEKIKLMLLDKEQTQTTNEDLIAIMNAEAELDKLRTDAAVRNTENMKFANTLRKQEAADKEAEVAKQDELNELEIERLQEFRDRKKDLENEWKLEDAETDEEFYEQLKDQEKERFELELKNEKLTNEEKLFLKKEHERNIHDIDKESLKSKQKIDAEKRASDARNLASASQTLGNMASLFEENTVAYKAFASAQVIIDTARAIMGFTAGYSTIPVAGQALAIAASVATAAMGAASLAKINGVEFAKGGVLQGPSHAQGGILTPYGELEGGEGVINNSSMASPDLRNMASIANVAGGGADFSTGDGSVRLSSASISQIVNGINNKKVYVSESDITEVQNKVSVIEQESFL